MPVEIERKFLVASEAWRTAAGAGVPIAQGYLSVSGPFAVRVRRMGDAGFLTMKSNDAGLQRLEFEYPIPAADAETMLSQLGADGLRLEKTRYLLQHDGHEWSVDVFGGALTGLVLAEIELSDPDEIFAKPDWLGAEVTHDLRYRNAVLAERGLP
jgi:adenylate cyclase